ncbi:MAG: sugar phosphate isomerase/epimerase [Fimbriimonadaceae bacterium]|nr:sugar phosphate isomerase/epimerase [Fimbriimonadaceae bacterium]
MRIGLFAALLNDKPLDEVLDFYQAEGLQAIELGGGAYPGAAHLDLSTLIKDSAARNDLKAKVEDHGLIISAISCHGNPIHPDLRIAKEHHEAFRRSVELAALLGVKTVNGFSGCPGDHAGAKNPNWVTCAWPDEYRDILDYQWNEVAIPYWTEQNAFLDEHDVNFGIEMHPGFIVYNNDTLLRLRSAAGNRIGANFDPSHLWWQGIDPLLAVRQLCEAGAVFHVHAKDAVIDPVNSGHNGNLDTKSYGDHRGRAWQFRSVGYGHGAEWWKTFVSDLRRFGYDFVLSIEHEDGLMSAREGLRKAISVLREAVIQEEAGPMFWARD